MKKEKVKVLVVDDDRRMVRTVNDILKSHGYDTVLAYTGEEDVESVRSEAPDCVLMDIRMPGIGGVEACRRIREIAPDLPVILVSAYATEEAEAEARRYGVSAVLTKPLDLQKVLSFLSLLQKEESILVVDDDPNFSKTLRDILQARGYRVKTEADPGKTLDDLAENYKLVVLLDLNLGEVSGLDVLKEIRAKYPSKPVVLVTGYREEMSDSIKKGLQIGAYACLYKPLEVERLVALVEEVSRNKARSVLEGERGR